MVLLQGFPNGFQQIEKIESVDKQLVQHSIATHCKVYMDNVLLHKMYNIVHALLPPFIRLHTNYIEHMQFNAINFEQNETFNRKQY